MLCKFDLEDPETVHALGAHGRRYEKTVMCQMTRETYRVTVYLRPRHDGVRPVLFSVHRFMAVTANAHGFASLGLSCGRHVGQGVAHHDAVGDVLLFRPIPGEDSLPPPEVLGVVAGAIEALIQELFPSFDCRPPK